MKKGSVDTVGTRRGVAKNSSDVSELSIQTEISHHEDFHSPLPSAEDFQGYENAVQGAGDRILSIFEKQVNHRIELEREFSKNNMENQNKIVENEIQLKSMSVSLAFLVVLVCIVLFGVLSLFGVQSAWTVMVVPALSVVCVIIQSVLGKKNKNKDSS